MSVSNVGSLAYVPALGSPDVTVAWVDRNGAEHPVPQPPRAYIQPRLAPDDHRLAVPIADGSGGSSLWIYDFERDALTSATSIPSCRPVLPRGGQVFSPDGRFVAYVSSESGRNEVYVRPLSGNGGRWQISTDGGNEVVWPRKAHELFYRNGDALVAVDITTKPTFTASKPRRLFQGQYVATTALWANYDVTSDGQRFLMIKPVTASQARPHVINVMLNWPEELKQLSSGQR